MKSWDETENVIAAAMSKIVIEFAVLIVIKGGKKHLSTTNKTIIPFESQTKFAYNEIKCGNKKIMEMPKMWPAI